MIGKVYVRFKRYPGDPFKRSVDTMAKKNPLANLSAEELLLQLENAVVNYNNKSSKLNLGRMVDLEKEILSRLCGNYYAFEELQEMDELQIKG